MGAQNLSMTIEWAKSGLPMKLGRNFFLFYLFRRPGTTVLTSYGFHGAIWYACIPRQDCIPSMPLCGHRMGNVNVASQPV